MKSNLTLKVLMLSVVMGTFLCYLNAPVLAQSFPGVGSLPGIGDVGEMVTLPGIVSRGNSDGSMVAIPDIVSKSGIEVPSALKSGIEKANHVTRKVTHQGNKDLKRGFRQIDKATSKANHYTEKGLSKGLHEIENTPSWTRPGLSDQMRNTSNMMDTGSNMHTRSTDMFPKMDNNTFGRGSGLSEMNSTFDRGMTTSVNSGPTRINNSMSNSFRKSSYRME